MALLLENQINIGDGEGTTAQGFTIDALSKIADVSFFLANTASHLIPH